MHKAITKLISSIALLFILGVAISFTDHEDWLGAWFVIFIFAGIPVFFLSWIDLGRGLRKIEEPSKLIKVLAVIFGVPQALFGLIAFVLGSRS